MPENGMCWQTGSIDHRNGKQNKSKHILKTICLSSLIICFNFFLVPSSRLIKMFGLFQIVNKSTQENKPQGGVVVYIRMIRMRRANTLTCMWGNGEGCTHSSWKVKWHGTQPKGWQDRRYGVAGKATTGDAGLPQEQWFTSWMQEAGSEAGHQVLASHYGLICVAFMASATEHPFMSSLVICISNLNVCLFQCLGLSFFS